MLKYVLIILLVVTGHCSPAQQIIAGTYNLRFDNAADSGNLWKDRAPVITSLIRFYDFDLLGTQEGLKNQLDDIRSALPGYDMYGVGRNDGINAGEHSAIFYKKERFSLLDKGDFWLSETPAQPSLGWDARCCKRICSWVKLRDVTARKDIWVFNAHYDHEGVIARKKAVS